MNNNFPENDFLSLKQIIGDPKAKPPITPIIPVSRTTWLDGVKRGRFPKPVKLNVRVVVWKAKDIRDFIASL
jgi:hypothetical protein